MNTWKMHRVMASLKSTKTLFSAMWCCSDVFGLSFYLNFKHITINVTSSFIFSALWRDRCQYSHKLNSICLPSGLARLASWTVRFVKAIMSGLWGDQICKEARLNKTGITLSTNTLYPSLHTTDLPIPYVAVSPNSVAHSVAYWCDLKFLDNNGA